GAAAVGVDHRDRRRDHGRVGSGRAAGSGSARSAPDPADSTAVMTFTVFLVPAGRDRFELYSEPPEEAPVAPDADAGRIRHAIHAAHVKWHSLVDGARRGEAASM